MSNTRPKTSTEKSRSNGNHLLAALKRSGELRRLGRGRLKDAAFPWRKWARFVANELLAMAPGDHVDEKTETAEWTERRYERVTVTKTRRKVIRWPEVNAAVVLCYGPHRLFDRPDEAPPEIVAEVKKGVADAVSIGLCIRFTASDIARALGITAAEKIAAKAWSIGAVDVTPEEWAEIIRLRRAEQQRARRRADGDKPQEESVAAQARALGIKESTLRSRLFRERKRAEKAAAGHATVLKPRNIYKTRKASKTLHSSAASVRPIVTPQNPIPRDQPPAPLHGGRGAEVFGLALEGWTKNLAASHAWKDFFRTMEWARAGIAAREIDPEMLRSVIPPEIVKASLAWEACR